MTHDNWQAQQGSSGMTPPPQGQPMPPPQGQPVPAQGAPAQGAPQYGAPGQIPLPPPEKKSTGNKRHGWLYVALGVIFLLLGGIGLLGPDTGALDWAFLVLGVVNLAMGASAVRHANSTIDPFAPKG